MNPRRQLPLILSVLALMLAVAAFLRPNTPAVSAAVSGHGALAGAQVPCGNYLYGGDPRSDSFNQVNGQHVTSKHYVGGCSLNFGFNLDHHVIVVSEHGAAQMTYGIPYNKIDQLDVSLWCSASSQDNCNTLIDVVVY